MREIALHLLDIAENSVAAQATNITVSVREDLVSDRLWAAVIDDGKGMDAETVTKVVDPFVTSRTTRKVGLGIPLFKAAAEACNGYLKIDSQVGQGTQVEVEFERSHIDRMPLGDLAATFLTLVIAYPGIHWRLEYSAILPGSKEPVEFDFDDQPVKKELEGIALSEPVVLTFLRQSLEEGIREIQNQMIDIRSFEHASVQ